MNKTLERNEMNKNYFQAKEMIRGALVGATFGALGAKIRDWYDMFHHVGGVAGLTSQEPGVYHGTSAPFNMAQLHDNLPKAAIDDTYVKMKIPLGVDAHAQGVPVVPSVDPVQHVTPAVHETPIVKSPIVHNIPKAPIHENIDPVKTNEYIPKDLDTNDTGINTPSHNADDVIKVDVPKDDVIQTPDAPATDVPIDDGEGMDHPIIEVKGEPIVNQVPDGTVPEVKIADAVNNVGNPGAVTNGDIAPLQRIYNTGGVADIAPNQPLGGNGGGIELANNPYKDIPNPHHLSRTDAFNFKPGTEHISEQDAPWHNVTATPEKGLRNPDDLKDFFGKENIEYERPDSDMINGMSHEECHKASDDLFEKNHFPFTSYDQYQKESMLQEMFGHGSKAIKEVANPDGTIRNARVYTMEYFKKAPEWATVEKIPAKYLFDFSNPTMINGSEIPKDQLESLVSSGTLKDLTPDATGPHTYEFAHKDELEKLSKLYRAVTPKQDQILGNDKPIGDENVESYMARIAKRIHKTINGTDYGIKDRKIAIEKIRKFRLGLSGSLRIGGSSVNFGPGGTSIGIGFNNGWY
jgi:hypothetical protein